MARYPGAVWKPITAPKGRKALTVTNRVNLHSTGSSASSQHAYFNQSGIPDSHFHVAYDGTVEQYVDTSMRAFADLEGNDATISIETAGVAKNGNEDWTLAQLIAIIDLIVWILRTHDIPWKLATSSKVGDSSHGLSWHRLGIDGNFPSLPSIQAGRLQRGGGMNYSTSFGKICPGYGRVEQIHKIVWPDVLAELNGRSTSTGGPMADLTEAEQREILITTRQTEIVVRRIEETLATMQETATTRHNASYNREVATLAKLDTIESKVDALPDV